MLRTDILIVSLSRVRQFNLLITVLQTYLGLTLHKQCGSLKLISIFIIKNFIYLTFNEQLHKSA